MTTYWKRVAQSAPSQAKHEQHGHRGGGDGLRHPGLGGAGAMTATASPKPMQ